jgi:hypothetical protein
MADKTRNYDEELARIMNALAESTLEISEEELGEELREEGDAPERVAEEVRGVLRRAVKAHQQRNLLAAQKKYEDRLLHLEKKYSLPDSVEEQRKLLMGLLATNSNVRSLLTAQNRDFTDLPDSEVTIYLKQLHELGALDNPSGEKEEQ